ncbi:nicotinamide mononucleotide deamidase-related protein YfaY [Erwinia psidii]|uniref:CinA-like protein n=1 Tax=Erwinia psidii TaxID=69224 RepID=A0A3N6UVD5_9GAMM|nr:nicotinamide mononucleotide deamidase-related protein YfaY [Erwinia psidii]MCX8956586.1 nicotinamide mononucleotide deamidase-related protein YfaY [Erwinia psidii]MCX8961504.1 nicotinamide mononucleotide deamidase-related protein YfaY [Erwinia psidii]MCX8965028.1 nicotinamide mononucleotide deamidase-related protein YfaY [Erwinia psidii]RQM39919.1 nicotinamide mononucleotide deamidase-related protein YfaY [Erwinia psidii]
MIRVEMLATGDEVLHGQIVDTNAAWLAEVLLQNGLPMTRRQTVGDSLDELVTVLKERSKVADVLIVNGGLGPTSDDLSALAAANAAGVALVLHESWLAKMEAFFAGRGRKMAESNRKQAELPAGAELLDNPVGTACGFAMTLNRSWIFFTPGVPSEYKVMVEQQILPRLKARFSLPEQPVCLRLTTFGRGESDLASEIEPLPLPEGVVMGYRASMPIIELKLNGPASKLPEMQQFWQQVREIAGESLIFEGFEGLPAQLSRRLKEEDYQLAISEQFTSGLLHWQLASAEAPLAVGSVLPASNETLAQLVARSHALAQSSQTDLALVVGSLKDEHLNIALHTPTGSWGQKVKFNVNRHGLKTRQDVVAMMALNMLRRWLNGMEVSTGHGWIDVVETVVQ